MCVMGCQCDQGFVKTGSGSCVKPEDCPKTKSDKNEEVDCLARPDPGECKAGIPRFYYDPAEERCKQFLYGGCRGNTNNFNTEEECKAICAARFVKSRTACVEDKKLGPCRGAFPRFFFNKQTGQCERFSYGGCDGNSNNFMSKEDCEAVCIN
ncbi:unnamed protein product [Larinioides sclopetarius]|uniref:BPTI/Kunitz inhibitor domain-containing protein n=1 Tax=Larinioides sclopetarius TaxID=280406 RepID=A0AAV2BSR4_9ARAC